MKKSEKFGITMKRDYNTINDFMNSGDNAYGDINGKKFWVEARNGMMVVHSPENPVSRVELNNIVDFMYEKY